MRNISKILESAFVELSSTEIVERVVDSNFIRDNHYFDVWDIHTQMFISDVAEDLCLRVAFKETFPYELPDVYYYDTKYDYFPHIDYKDRKLCLLEDGTYFPVDNPLVIIKYCILRAKVLIVAGAKKENTDDFKNEILSYWEQEYNNEPIVNSSLIFWGDIPSKTSKMEIWDYSKPILSESSYDYSKFSLIVPKDVSNFDIEKFLGPRFQITKEECLFIHDISVLPSPPYDVTVNKLLPLISSEQDRNYVKTLIRRNDGFFLLFQLMDSSYIAGVKIEKISVNTNGFRKGKKSVYRVWTEFECKNRKLQRILCYPYSSERVVQRTRGRLQDRRNICIAGLGSIGSNLCYFMAGHNNSSLVLVDGQSLSPENIGRHFLGFHYVGNPKALAMSDMLKKIRPDFEISSHHVSLEQYVMSNFEDLKSCCALFICTGDIMSERFILNLIDDGSLSIPVFMLWLEPYAVAGHLIYINPKSYNELKSVFDIDGYYRYSLIASEEYINSTKKFIKRDVGCNSRYVQYSGSDVIIFLSSIYPTVEKLLEFPDKSKAYRWIGNINILNELSIKQSQMQLPESGCLQEFDL